MLNTYYLADLATFNENASRFHPQLGAHYIVLPSGKLLVSAHFPAVHGALESWEVQEGVEGLPHPVFEGTKPIADSHVEQLAHLGIVKGHTVLDVAKAVGGIHPLMKLRSF